MLTPRLQAYSTWIRGTFAFEKNQWQEAKDQLTVSIAVYQTILGDVHDDEVKLLYQQVR